MERFDKKFIEDRGLLNGDLEKINWMGSSYDVYPGMIMLSIPESAYMENSLSSGFNFKGEELTEVQKKANESQRKTFEEDYLKAGDELLVIGVGDNDNFEFAKVGDLVTLNGHTRLQGMNLDMSYVAEDGSLINSIHVSIVRASDVLMKKKF